MNPTRDATSSEGPHLASATSRSLLVRVQADEPQAWERLVGLYAPLVRHWCRRAGLQDHDMADIFQEVFRAVLVYIGSFRKRGKGDTFRGWLRRITQNKVRDHFRNLGREVQGVGGSSAQDRLAQLADNPKQAVCDEQTELDADAERSLFARALAGIRAEFEERTWAAFWKTTVEGRSTKDVGLDLSMTPGAVRVAKSRVLHRLRAELGDVSD
jgi:RNA polymerase sigma-70 factor (ECF subfamily)